MAKYRKRPVVVEAVQFFNETWDWWPNKDCCDIFGRGCVTGGCPPGPHLHSYVGAWKVVDGDWIITLKNGTRTLLKPDIFEQTYEKVEG